MKRIIVVLAALVIAFISFILWYRWDSEENHGFTFGYYGQLNTVSNTLAQFPGVNILKCGYNADVTLEEFGFDVRIAGNRDLHIWFAEDDPIRKMSGQQLSQTLQNRIREEVRSQSLRRDSENPAGTKPEYFLR